jgi:NAD(P)-dependent dehydrogenase (short-subunit alcohol dehydrogenase family)
MAELPDHSGKTALVTGGDMGIGLATAIGLARAGTDVLITSRPPATGAEAVAAIRAASGDAQVHAVSLELSSFRSIRATVTEVLDLAPRLDILVNNAGGVLTTRHQTEEGLEMTFGVNYVGPFLLTMLLRDRLAEAHGARIVNLSSSQHKSAGAFDFDKLAHIGEENGIQAYNHSKLAMALFATELARRWEGAGISAFAVAPGAVRSNFGRHGETGGWPGFTLKLIRPLENPPSKGALASLYCATAPGLERESGGYFERGFGGNVGKVRRVQPSVHAQDPKAAKELWDRTEALIAAANA